MGRYQDDGDDELQEAEDRIARIRGGSGGAAQPDTGGSRAGQPTLDDDFESEAVSRARSRSRTLRGDDSRPQERQGRGGRAESGAVADEPRRGPAGAPSPFLIIGGVVGAGVAVVLILLAVRGLAAGGGFNFFATATPTPTFTPEATATPTPTETPTITPTIAIPNLQLPGLTCIFQSGQGCFDYCQVPENNGECDAARSFIEAQGADPTVFFTCLSPDPGPNQGDPVECIEEAWLANNAP